tara:strand:- start:157 stop:363 length:207 start_codon:yes stop_codon:yes gene_type:complete
MRKSKMVYTENEVIYEVDIGEKLSGKDIDIIAEIIHGVLENEGINTDNDNEDLDGFTFDVIAYYAKEK